MTAQIQLQRTVTFFEEIKQDGTPIGGIWRNATSLIQKFLKRNYEPRTPAKYLGGPLSGLVLLEIESPSMISQYLSI